MTDGIITTYVCTNGDFSSTVEADAVAHLNSNPTHDIVFVAGGNDNVDSAFSYVAGAASGEISTYTVTADDVLSITVASNSLPADAVLSAATEVSVTGDNTRSIILDLHLPQISFENIAGRTTPVCTVMGVSDGTNFYVLDSLVWDTPVTVAFTPMRGSVIIAPFSGSKTYTLGIYHVTGTATSYDMRIYGPSTYGTPEIMLPYLSARWYQ